MTKKEKSDDNTRREQGTLEYGDFGREGAGERNQTNDRGKL